MPPPGGGGGGGGGFTTGRPPPALAAMPVKVTGRSSQPLILSSLHYYRGDGFSYLVFWDETGAIVWYLDQPPPSRPQPFARLPGGTFFFRDRHHLIEVTPLGEVVNRFERGGQWGFPHHELTVLGDGCVIYPSYEFYVFDDSVNGGAAETTFQVDNLRVWDPATGGIEQVWDAKEAWDILDPNQRVAPRPVRDGRYDWTHLNSVTIGPRGNVILSFRARNQVISLSPDFRTIEWQLGGPDSDYRFPNPGDRFYRQHTAAQLANGNVLLFDNGYSRPDSEGGHYSRALELSLDAAAGTAVKVWEYRPEPDVYSSEFSSAYRLSNGNTLVNFGRRQRADQPLLVVEVDPAGNEVFRFEDLPSTAVRPRRYRAYGDIESIMGETMLRPPAAAPAPAHVETVADGFTVAVDVARFRESEAAMAGAQHVAGGPFDLYLAAERLVYRKEPCAPEAIEARFFLHVVPVAPGDLPAGRRASGFDNLDFHFVEYGERWQGVCLAAVPLPGYRIARLRTGQFAGGEHWERTISADSR